MQNCSNRRRAAFPEKLHVGALYFDVERIGRERQNTIHSFDGIWPVAYSEVGLRRIVKRNGIARIDCFSFLVGGNSLGQVSLPPLHRSNVETDIAIIRKSLRCQKQFAQSFLVVALLVIEIETEGEMPFAQIGLESKRFIRFTTCGLFDLLCRFEPMIDLAHDGRKPRVGEREVWVHFDRLSIKISRCPKILQQVIGTRLIIASPQIEHVSVGICCGFSFDASFLLW